MIAAAPDAFADRAIDALLAGYALGSLDAPLHALVASHLAISSKNRSFVLSLEAANGAALDAVEPIRLPDRERKLTEIFAAGDASAANPAPKASDEQGALPAPLVQYIGVSLPQIPWQASSRTPWIETFRVEESDQGAAVLYRIQPDRDMPPHAQPGSDVRLVLQGGFTDASGHYGPGDIAVAKDPDDPSVTDHDGCLCFVVTDAPRRLLGRIGRVLQLVFQTPAQPG